VDVLRLHRIIDVIVRRETEENGALRKRRITVALIVLAISMGLGSGANSLSPVDGPALSPNDVRAGKAALKSIEDKRWSRAEHQIKNIKSPLAVKIFRWMDYSRVNESSSFSEISAFIEENPEWPDRPRLLRRAEEAITDKTPASELLSWFKKFPPVSAVGRTRLGAALLATGKTNQARDVLRKVWINGNFTKQQERYFLKRYRKYLTQDDHVKRMERLLWDDKYWPARRMLWKVPLPYRTLAEARLMLMRREGNVDAAIRKVPPELKTHPGLIFERLRWRRRKGVDESALELLTPPPPDMIHPDKWWKERSVLARSALKKGHISDAYRISKEHGLTEGVHYAEGEWLAGWIALRFLEDYKVSLEHFTNMYQSVKYPISRARGAYWAGRAAEKLNDTKATEKWYGIAASFPTSYYGQLAFARINPGSSLKIPDNEKPLAEEIKSFSSHELVKAAKILNQIGDDKYLKSFIKAIGGIRNSQGWLSLTADLAHTINRPDLAVIVAKIANKSGWLMTEHGYPMITPPLMKIDKDSPVLEVPLVLAMIRQESAFNNVAKSHAGARGLLQLMPRTASKIAKKLHIPYSQRRLLSDPDYNLKLGQAYLAGLVEEFNGSYVLALVAYNAGPSRAWKWMRRNGDPRDPAIDAIDWIELIPFRETRNYVQRVLEHLQMYRIRLSETEIALRLENDLHK